MADIRQSGIGGLRGVNTQSGVVNTMTPEQQAFHEQVQRESKLVKHGRSLSYQAPYETMLRPKTYEVGSAEREYGKSRYDKGHDILPVSGFDELQQNRYDNQPWYDVAANGIAKAAGRAATSFITGVAGGLWGIGEFVTEGVRNGDWNATRLIDNSLSNALADLDEWADKNFVNYKSIIQRQNEENGEWYKNLGSLNMIMDDIVTNFGFIVGMGASAAVTGGALGAGANLLRKGAAGALHAARRSGNMAKIAAATKAAGIVDKYGRQTAKALTMINSSAGEAALEGLTVRREMMDEETARINDSISEGMRNDPELQSLDAQYQQQIDQLEEQYAMRPKDANYQALKNAISQDYHNRRSAVTQQWEQRRAAAMEELNQSSEEAGMATALLNMAILIPSNFNLYGRLVDKSFRNAEKSAGKAWASNNSAIHARNGIGQRNVTGGIQGKSMAAIRNGKNYGSRTFLGNEAKRIGSTMFSEGVYEEMGQSAVSTGAKAYHEWADADNYWRARLDPDSINDVTDGSHDFLQALGQGLKETYGSIDGWREGFIGGITGGLFGGASIGTEWRDTRFARRAAKDLNKQLQSDRLPNLLQHIVAQGFHEKNKEGYAAEGNQRDWKTEDDKAAFSLISSFDRAGRMDDLYYLINSYTEGMSDEDIEDLVNSSTRRVTSQEQIAQMKKTIQQETAQKVESFLKDGASIDDYNAATTAVRDADERVAQAEQAVEAARQRAADESGNTRWLQKSAQSIRNQARTARRSRNKAMAKDIRDALDALDAARAAQANANKSLNSMMSSQDSKAGIEAALAEHENRMRRADNSAPEEFLEGPFSNANGTNTLTNDEVREQIKHNTDRIHEVVERYKDAIEKVNRDTRGILSKDQEDYLAYTQFMAESSGQRAQELVQKWRGVLPEVLSVRHKSAKAAAKMFQVSENDVVEDSDNHGFFRVSTKNMTDEQFSNFILHGLLKQSHVKHKNDDGSGADSEALRGSLADEALNLIDKEMRRANKQQRFDRDELRRDFDDVEDHFKKNKAFAEAYMDALSNPEGVMSAKDRWMRKLKKKYDQTKAKLRQKRMSVQQLGDLSDDELSGLDDYHYALAKAEKIRRKVADFFNRKAPDIYSKIEDVFKDIQDPDVRAEIIERVKDRVDTIISRMSRYEEEDGPIDVDSEEIAAMIDLDDILPDDDELWDRITPKTKKAIQDGLKRLNDFMNKMSGDLKSVLGKLRNRFNKLRDSAEDFAEKIGVDSTIESIRDSVSQLLKGRLTDDQVQSLLDHAKAIREKIAKLNEAAAPGYKAAVKLLNNLLNKIESCIKQYRSARKHDTEPASSSQPSASSTRSQRRKAEPQKPVDVSVDEDEQHLQNPTLEEEESVMQFQEDIETGSLVTDDIWQSVTGESARRSNFTYQPYHVIVERELAKLPDNTPDDEEITIKDFGDKGNKHTVADWRKYAKRSRIVWERLESSGAFGYIDSGKITTADGNNKIEFLLSKQDGVFVVYLMHNGNIIGDLSDPEYGGNGTGLDEMYKKFREEYGSSTGDVKSKYSTTVANIYAGFMHYAPKEKGKIPSRTIASFGAAANGLTFFVSGVTNPGVDTRDIIGKGRDGQPFVLIPAPANDGMTRMHAVPVSTHAIESDGPEIKVVRALLNSDIPLDAKRKFLNHFFNCRGVVIDEIEASPLHRHLKLSDTDEEVTQITIITRDSHDGTEIRSTITIPKDTSKQVLIENGESLRANVSFALLNGTQNVVLYERIAKEDPSLPKTYNDFLKEICHTSLADLGVHNSWITINKLEFDKDGNAHEVKDPVEDHSAFTVKGQDTVIERDPYLGESYRITINKEGVGSIPAVLKVEVSRNRRKFRTDNMSEATRARMLPVIAAAVARATSAAKGSTVKFTLDGVTYECQRKSKTSVGPVTVSNDTVNNGFLDSRIVSSFRPMLSSFASTKKSVDDILAKWFRKGYIKKNSDEYLALKSILEAMKNGKSSFAGVSAATKITLLNARLPQTQEQREGVEITMRLIDRLRATSNGKFNIIEDQAEGQRIIDLWKRGKAPKGVKMFTKNGRTVYGFAYNGNIYLDPDVMKPETLIHEYTHLWAEILRSDPIRKEKVWDRLVGELRNTSMWDKVVKKYKHLKTDDEIADEVFAQLSGKEGEKWLRDLLKSESDSGDDIDSAFAKTVARVREIFNELMDYIKEHLLGVKPETRTLREVMQEFVWTDMLSDNPLGNFDKLEQRVDNLPPAEVKQDDKVPPGSFKMSDYISSDGSSNIAELIEGDGEVFEINGEQYFRLPEGTTPEDFDLVKAPDVKAQIDLEEPIAVEGMSTAFSSNLSMMLNSGEFQQPSEEFSAFTERLERAQQRNYTNVDDFVRAAKLCLSEEQRDSLWKQMSTYMVTRGLYRHQILAHMQSLFNRYMENGTVGNEVIDKLFLELNDGITKMVNNSSSITDALLAYSSIPSSMSATPSDTISSISKSELKLAHSESLDLLTDQDVEFLKLAGVSETTYKALSDESKERLRRCVL